VLKFLGLSENLEKELGTSDLISDYGAKRAGL